MIPQYAAASVVSQSKGLCMPASVDSIPSSQGQEDHVSMGTIASRKAATIIRHVQSVLAVELICAAQAVDFKDAGKLSKGPGPPTTCCAARSPLWTRIAPFIWI